MNNPTPAMSSVPSIAAGGSNPAPGGVPLFTPPQTPGVPVGVVSAVNGHAAPVAGVKRESESAPEESGKEKRRRVAPTLVGGETGAPQPPPGTGT